MSTWLTESELRRDTTGAAYLTLNVAFLQEIKQDQVEIRLILNDIKSNLSSPRPNIRNIVDSVNQLRDELETYFALEEFYGYFEPAKTQNTAVGGKADDLRSQHESIFLSICDLVETAEGVLYREVPHADGLNSVARCFTEFFEMFQAHEQKEMELMMALCNEDIGVGD